MNVARRRFLQATLGSATLVASGPWVPRWLVRSAQAAVEQAGGEKVLVVLELSGGNDGVNTVIAHGDEGYARHRSVLRIPAAQVLGVADGVGLHPAMGGFAELLEEGHLAIVQGVGYPNPNRSHFRSMDIWHSAQPEQEQPRDGWLGRCLDARPPRGGRYDVPALHVGDNELPLALASRQTAVPSVDSIEGFRLRADGGVAPATLRALAEHERSGDGLLDFVQRSALAAYASSQQVQEALAQPRGRAAYPGSRLAGKLRTIAQLIDAGLGTRIYYLSQGGYDTHANQLPTHANLLGELASSVRAFCRDLAERGHLDRVLVLGFSEFGRRVEENASRGTDHGTAAPVFLAGGRVQAGLVGAHPSLTDLEQGDLKFHTDFRRVYATILERWLDCTSEAVLEGHFEPLALVRA